ncbi:uncharacterized protein LOC133175309 [Saccostrea echinata]|uniref:uncharacterized protein LOC133175309 n=1 Tax=Saccostrea echinata TaxID=191078 RepID=UPI002A80BE30|nr:uncharacterized protein LOC133175309 [Saccostrea echinata]
MTNNYSGETTYKMPANLGLEKYQLVLLIVGSTVCVVATWLIVDFCLYHRERKARRDKNKKDTWHQHQTKTRLLIPFTKKSTLSTSSIPAAEPQTNGQTSFQKFLSFFNIKKNEENQNNAKQLEKRSQSFNDANLKEKKFISPKSRRFTEMFSNKVSNLNIESDSKTTTKKEENRKIPKDTEWKQGSPDRENLQSADSGHFSEGRRGGETKWKTEFSETDEAVKDDIGFSDVEEVGISRSKKKSKKKKEGNSKKTFSLLHHRYI